MKLRFIRLYAIIAIYKGLLSDRKTNKTGVESQ